MSDTLFGLSGRQILVTGGTRGIGRAITLQLARAGAKVLANYARDEAAAHAVVETASAAGLSVALVKADLTSEKGMERVMDAVKGELPLLSGFVHSAATGVHRPLEDLTLRHFDWTFALNIRAFFDLMRRLTPLFQEGSTVVALSSEGAVRAVHQYTLVGSSKGALESMVRHCARELAPRGIRVNAISPGSVRTDAWNVLPGGEQRLAEAAARAPSGRLTTLDEVAWATQFLCSPASGGVAGHTLVVDGGARNVE